jgi:hypothetical protein
LAFGTNTTTTNKAKGIIAGRLNTVAAGTAPKFVAAGVGATGAARTAAAADTALSSELAEGRTSGTETNQTSVQTGDVYQVVGTITSSGSRAVDECALFDAVTVGNMFLSATFPVVNLATGDSIVITARVQIT